MYPRTRDFVHVHVDRPCPLGRLSGTGKLIQHLHLYLKSTRLISQARHSQHTHSSCLYNTRTYNKHINNSKGTAIFVCFPPLSHLKAIKFKGYASLLVSSFSLRVSDLLSTAGLGELKFLSIAFGVSVSTVSTLSFFGQICDYACYIFKRKLLRSNSP